MPTLPPDFIFHQANLQDYVECRQRFQLRYLLELSWPAPIAEPADEYEAHVRDGEAFHRLIQQHQSGLPPDRLTAQAEAVLEGEDEQESYLAIWWRNYLTQPPSGLPVERHPEITLTAPIGGRRLLAKYDLVAVEPSRRAVIVDWKTSARRSTGAWLAARLQTRVYRYLLAAAGAHLNAGLRGDAGKPFAPEQIEMIYWFAAFPAEPERLRYDRTQFEADGRYLTSLIAEIAGAADSDFPLTDDAKRCRFCPYRSLCDRGTEAGSLAEADEGPAAAEEPATDGATSFDFEQIAEIAF